jgi:hypothetical protein
MRNTALTRSPAPAARVVTLPDVKLPGGIVRSRPRDNAWFVGRVSRQEFAKTCSPESPWNLWLATDEILRGKFRKNRAQQRKRHAHH